MLLALLSCAGKAGAQTVAVKSDLLTGGMLASPNLGVELKLSERFTLEAEGVSKCTPSVFYAQSPDFHKLGLCYYLKILYL